MKLSHRILNLIKGAALLALAAAAIAVAQPQAHANDQVPYRAKYDTQFETVVNPPIAEVFATGVGRATHLGRMDVQSIEETVNLATGEGFARYRYIASNGDAIEVEIDFNVAPTPAGFASSGTWQITGGTGRFDGASGSGVLTGQIEFTGPNSGKAHIEMDGTISSPGSLN